MIKPALMIWFNMQQIKTPPSPSLATHTTPRKTMKQETHHEMNDTKITTTKTNSHTQLDLNSRSQGRAILSDYEVTSLPVRKGKQQ